MADWGNAFSSMAKSASGLLDSAIKKDDQIEAEQRAADTRLKLEERMSAIREAADQRAAEFREQLRIKGRDADFEFNTNPDNVKKSAQAEADKYTVTQGAKNKLEREEFITRGNDQGYLAAERNHARAKHIESASSIASANLSNFQLTQLKKLEGIQDEYYKAVDSGDAAAIEKAKQKLQANAKPDRADRKDSGDYLRYATNLREQAEKVDPSERAALIKKAEIAEALAGVDASKPAPAPKPGAPAPAAAPKVNGSPHPEGTRLTGPDGKIYVVQGGKPVLESQLTNGNKSLMQSAKQ